MNNFADLLLPLPLSECYTYSVPDAMQANIARGSRVIVSFGRKKQYTAIVVHLHDIKPEGYETKPLLALLDDAPILLRPQIKFWEWIAEYYLCTIGEVYRSALPTGLKLESETLLSVNNNWEEDPENKLSERELILLDTLSQHDKISAENLEKESTLRNILPTLRLLMDKEAVVLSEELKGGFRPKTEYCLRLTLSPTENETLREIFKQLSAAPKQLKCLMAYLDLSHFLHKGELKEVSKSDLMQRATASSAICKSMVDKGIFELYKRPVSRTKPPTALIESAHALSQPQQIAYHEIKTAFQTKQVTLLHGVTSSGKTEIYIKLIEEVIAQGRQVLYLVPEIALTTQLTARLQRVFGETMAIYHSKFSDNERVETWYSLLRNPKLKLVLGARSAIFLPFRDLGLVIIDEEHESSFKQYDPAPRYHARNAAIVLASMHGAKTLLGSATPAIESYYNALQGKYGLVELTTRFEEVALPHVESVNLTQLRKQKQMEGNNLSPQLIEEMEKAFAQKKQVILFQNRRGFSPFLLCKACGWSPHCIRCDVSLTYHKREHKLTCHYCGYEQPLPRICPQCGSDALDHKGFGTERIEEEVATLFPEEKILRMDLDTTSTRKKQEEIVNSFQQKKASILVGTQMVTKGLDFDNVMVVGILSADSLMNYPDFRAHERAYQLMAQVAGRAGRRADQGKVILQTSDPTHPLITQVIENDYVAMYHLQLQERKLFNYPPFTRLIYIYLKHRDERQLESLAASYAQHLRARFGDRILGPDNPPVARIQMLYIRKIVLKIEIEASLPHVRKLLIEVHNLLQVDPAFRSLNIYYDVDPI